MAVNLTPSRGLSFFGLQSYFNVCMDSRFLGSWKGQKWKYNSCFYRFSSLHHNVVEESSTSLGSVDIKSRNVAITRDVRSGKLDHAQKMFDEMPKRTVVSWNAMISGYAKWGKYSEALDLLSLMHSSSMKLNEMTSSSILSVCAHSKAGSQGEQIHCLVLKSGFEYFELVGSSLLYFYSSCYNIEGARKVFDDLHGRNELLWSLMLVGYVHCNLMTDALSVFNRMPNRDVIAWTTLISGYSKSSDECEKALKLFQRMRKCGEAIPNEFTLDCLVRACGRLGDVFNGKAVHGLLLKSGFELESSITCALIDFYCNNELIEDAIKVYGCLVNPCLNVSNVLIQGLLETGRVEEAELIFKGLGDDRSSISYNMMIKGYALCGHFEESKRIYMESPERNSNCTNTMIHALSRNGEIHKALELFEGIKAEGDSVTWNSMISGYIENDQHENAILLYVDMRRLSITYTRSTFSALFRACSCLCSLKQGQQIHGQLIKTPFELNVYVGTALVDMYSKCGTLADADASFTCIPSPNVAAWTALIYGYAYHSLGNEAITLFEQMLKQGVKPNAATFVAILSACSAAGLVDEGKKFFNSIEHEFGISPSLEHYTCVVDLLGRAGCVQEVENLFNDMPFEPDEVLLNTTLNACWLSMDVNASKRMADKMLVLNPNSVSMHVIMSNLYARLGMWSEKVKIRNILKQIESRKDPGCSWLELNNKVHMFFADDKNHPCIDMIYATLKHLKADPHF